MSAVNPPEMTPEALEIQRREDARHRFSKKIARELFDACNAFKEDSKQWQRIAVAIQAAEEEIERLTKENEELRRALNRQA